jgi:hypothetical protein
MYYKSEQERVILTNIRFQFIKDNESLELLDERNSDYLMHFTEGYEKGNSMLSVA